MLLHCIRAFVREKDCILLTALAFIASNVYLYIKFHTYIFTGMSEDAAGWDHLDFTLRLALFLFYLFIIVSYESCRRLRRPGLEQVVQMLAPYRVYGAQTGMLAGIALLFTGSILAWNLAACSVRSICDKTVVWNTVGNIVVYFFVLDMLAICEGMALSFFKSHQRGFVGVLLICLLTSPAAELVVDTLGESGWNGYRILDWIQLAPRYLSWSRDSYLGYRLVRANALLPVFWMVICISFVMLRLLRAKRSKRVICCVSAAALLTVFFGCRTIPVGANGGINGWDLQKSVQGHLPTYYETQKAVEQEADFEVTDYDMNITAADQLKNTVRMNVSPADQEEYAFTLYHQYCVKRVFDADGHALTYRREGDYLYVAGTGGTGTICVSYEGAAAGFYAFSGGIYLPAYFAYYPRAGCFSVYDRENGGFLAAPAQTSHYTVTITSRCKAYTNLQQTVSQRFCGTTDGLEIAAGFLKETNINGVRVIYPYLGMQTVYSKAAIQKGLTVLLEQENSSCQYHLQNVTVFLSGAVNGARHYTFGSDWADFWELESGEALDYYQSFLQNEQNLPNGYFLEELEVEDE